MSVTSLMSSASKFGKTNPGALGAIGGATNSLFSALGSGTTKQTSDRLNGISPTLSNFSKKQQTADTVVDKLGSAGLASGFAPAMIGGAVLKGSNMLDKAFKNEDGMYRSKGAAVVANVVNPVALVKNAVTGQLFSQC